MRDHNAKALGFRAERGRLDGRGQGSLHGHGQTPTGPRGVEFGWVERQGPTLQEGSDLGIVGRRQGLVWRNGSRWSKGLIRQRAERGGRRRRRLAYH